MRDVLGHFVSGVVVVTSNGPDGPVGFTCQSFASLSLDPPLLTFLPRPHVHDVATDPGDCDLLRQHSRR
jgi:flavin reductase (DIM6/NTAB) family NADH-FMN oxidoreductase RutF